MSKLRKSAKGQNCTLQISGICNRNPETTVGAHIPSEWKGMGNKSPDFGSMVYACSSCHETLDNRSHVFWQIDPHFYMLRALQRTLKIMADEGVVKVA